MNIWELDRVILFVLVVFPGFISLKTYDLIIPGEKRDFSKSIIDIIAYSFFNYGILSWLILIITKQNFSDTYPILFPFCILLIFFILPATWPFIFIKISQSNIFKSIFVGPSAHPWDLVFSQRKARWATIHLKSGKVIRGIYGKNSSVSANGKDKMIYIEELWESENNTPFCKVIERTEGAIIFDSEIEYIEFFK